MIYTLFSKCLYLCFICLCAITEPVLGLPFVSTTLLGFGILSAESIGEQVALLTVYIFFLGISTQISWVFIAVLAIVLAAFILAIKVTVRRYRGAYIFGGTVVSAGATCLLSPFSMQQVHWFFSMILFCIACTGVLWHEQRFQRKKIHTWLSLNH